MAGVQVPARIFFDTIDDVLLVHDCIVIRIGVAPEVIRVHDFQDSGQCPPPMVEVVVAEPALVGWNTRRETTVE